MVRRFFSRGDGESLLLRKEELRKKSSVEYHVGIFQAEVVGSCRKPLHESVWWA